MKKLTKRKRQRYLRAIIQAIFFIISPSVFSTAFAGVKTIFQCMAKNEQITFSAFVVSSLIVCVYTIVFGRFFCGYACAFGTLGDAVYGISQIVQKKIKRKLPKLTEKTVYLLQYLKYIVLLAIVLMCMTGTYSKWMQGKNPWDVFSRLTALQFYLKGYEVGFTALVIVILLMAWKERFFCQFLCPMGAVFSLLPVLPLSLLKRNREDCIGRCSACHKTCPMCLDIDGETKKSGECIQCDACKSICPRANALRPIERNKLAGILFFVLKVACLMAICIFFF